MRSKDFIRFIEGKGLYAVYNIVKATERPLVDTEEEGTQHHKRNASCKTD